MKRESRLKKKSTSGINRREKRGIRNFKGKINNLSDFDEVENVYGEWWDLVRKLCWNSEATWNIEY